MVEMDAVGLGVGNGLCLFTNWS